MSSGARMASVTPVPVLMLPQGAPWSRVARLPGMGGWLFAGRALALYPRMSRLYRRMSSWLSDRLTRGAWSRFAGLAPADGLAVFAHCTPGDGLHLLHRPGGGGCQPGGAVLRAPAAACCRLWPVSSAPGLRLTQRAQIRRPWSGGAGSGWCLPGGSRLSVCLVRRGGLAARRCRFLRQVAVSWLLRHSVSGLS